MAVREACFCMAEVSFCIAEAHDGRGFPSSLEQIAYNASYKSRNCTPSVHHELHILALQVQTEGIYEDYILKFRSTNATNYSNLMW